LNRIKQIFKTRSEKIIPFLTAGYPDLVNTVEMVLSAEIAGADMVELGMPFSDPLADGPIIQKASNFALENGVTIKWILETVKKIRESSSIPLVLMGYINPIIKYGIRKFLSECRNVGVDGLIIPDLPPEEADEFLKLSKENKISLILLVAPNTSNDRIKYISKLAEDLIYCVSILGITGSDSSSDHHLEKYLKRVEEHSTCPFIVGFGISTREDVKKINQFSHGAVIGSAIIKQFNEDELPQHTVFNYITKLKNND
jgi:tryptophan synthase alpha chain